MLNNPPGHCGPDISTHLKITAIQNPETLISLVIAISQCSID